MCLSLSLSATRELKVDLSVAWTGEKEMQKTEKRGRHQVECRHENILLYRSKHMLIFFYLTSRHSWRDSLLLASLQKSSCRRDTSVGESGDSGQTSWVFDSVVERLGLEAWRRGDWEEMQLGTWWTKTEKVEE